LFGGKTTHQSNTTDVFFTFEVEVRISNLWVSPYSSYQQFLYETICKFRKKGWNYQEIADWFNSNDYTTARGKRFFNSSCQSIVKKKHLRDARLSKRHLWKLSDFALRLVDRTLINTPNDEENPYNL
jgi:hypothetical protein